MTMSGPPISNVRFAARGSSSAAREVRATSSTQIGWMRCRPSRSRHDGRVAHLLMNVGSAPPRGRRRSSAGRSCTRGPSRSSPAPSPTWRRSTGRRPSSSSLVPSALISTKRSTPASFAAAIRLRVPCVITRSKSLRLPLRIATRCTTCVQPSTAAAQARRIGDVAGRRARRPRLASCAPRSGCAHERAHVVLLRAQRVHDLRADEAGAAGDEDLHALAKFCQ